MLKPFRHILSMTITEIDSLIHLLDDPDEHIYMHVKDRLKSYGQDVVPVLETAWETKGLGDVFQTRVEDLIRSIQYDNLYDALEAWKIEGGSNLLDGAILAARYQFPELQEDQIRTFIHRVKQDVWLELNDNLTALEKVKIINHILFDVHGLTGDTLDYHNPVNSCLNQVIEMRKGNPLSLCIMYLVLANELNLPIYGVNLPKHFILAFVDEPPFMPPAPLKEKKVLFYINPFSKGAVFGQGDIDKFLKQLKLKADPGYFRPCDHITIMRRLFNNLVYSYQRIGEPEKATEVIELARSVK